MKHCTKDLMLAMAAMSAIGGTLASCDKKEEGKYNIVFIMTDDHTAQMMSCFDKRHIMTPNLDRIAEDGVRFTNAFVANSLSGPSRACLLTGKHSCANGFYDNRNSVFDFTQQTFPKLLQEAGYQTAERRIRGNHPDQYQSYPPPSADTGPADIRHNRRKAQPDECLCGLDCGNHQSDSGRKNECAS